MPNQRCHHIYRLCRLGYLNITVSIGDIDEFVLMLVATNGHTITLSWPSIISAHSWVTEDIPEVVVIYYRAQSILDRNP